jgi:hypothetical protein
MGAKGHFKALVRLRFLKRANSTSHGYFRVMRERWIRHASRLACAWRLDSATDVLFIIT